jgi:hypothetical protein
LRKETVYGSAVTHVLIELIRQAHGTGRGTVSAPFTPVRHYVAGLLTDLDLEMAFPPPHFFYFAVRKNFYVWVLGRLQHLRGEDARGTVIGRKCLVELGHTAAYSGLTLDEVHFETRFGQVQGRLNPAYSATDHHHCTDLAVVHDTPPYLPMVQSHFQTSVHSGTFVGDRGDSFKFK